MPDAAVLKAMVYFCFALVQISAGSMGCGASGNVKGGT